MSSYLSHPSHKLLGFHISLHITPSTPCSTPPPHSASVPYKLLAQLFTQPPTNHRSGPQECNISRKNLLSLSSLMVRFSSVLLSSSSLTKTLSQLSNGLILAKVLGFLLLRSLATSAHTHSFFHICILVILVQCLYFVSVLYSWCLCVLRLGNIVDEISH